jgi:hypothetical protein
VYWRVLGIVVIVLVLGIALLYAYRAASPAGY